MLKRKVTQEAAGIEGWETDRTEGNNREMTFRVKGQTLFILLQTYHTVNRHKMVL